MADPLLDHLVLATDDLESTVAAFQAATGVVPAAGGRHVGLGTRNYLVGLGPTAYLEIIGPDLQQAEVEPGNMPFGVGEVRGTRLVTWAVQPVDLEASLTAALEAGVDLGEIRPMSRATPAGDVLSWRLASTHPAPFDGLVPFLIDWGSTRHPAESGLPQVSLLNFTATHPDPPAVAVALDALGVTLPIATGPVALYAEVRGPAGVVALDDLT
ncbi:glyoxalase-like protein [Kribbella sp. VKM Ac-2527]|uniref:Glyoxalase-like protein n=1 Tax=Kribbella caucasensis TaxID=2512215 RepID=A0A4R6JKT7_9ACTN|nr:VOC family protein [Kribbella sp. VKM Ac-2527]TDO36322.1 glyoxalase-like protein [Kribbella sp. VKM Ac-2527]